MLHFDTPFLTDIAHNADRRRRTATATRDAAGGAGAGHRRHTVGGLRHQPAGTYDDEMLNAHFACGDGRVNENIALSAIHQIFHSEHDRLVADIEQTLHEPTLAQREGGAAGLAATAEPGPLER